MGTNGSYVSACDVMRLSRVHSLQNVLDFSKLKQYGVLEECSRKYWAKEVSDVHSS